MIKMGEPFILKKESVSCEPMLSTQLMLKLILWNFDMRSALKLKYRDYIFVRKNGCLKL